jgi:bifunctional DNA-binding transcriptional regulator/antitoxin component of YhaV-PrlF toxin-antitoxin module
MWKAIAMATQAKVVRPLRGGQITIPVEFRRELGIDADTLLRMTLENGELRIVPVKVTENTTGSAWVREFYEYFAPVREAIAKAGYTSEEINADIDAAIKAVREERD